MFVTMSNIFNNFILFLLSPDLSFYIDSKFISITYRIETVLMIILTFTSKLKFISFIYFPYFIKSCLKMSYLSP